MRRGPVRDSKSAVGQRSLCCGTTRSPPCRGTASKSDRREAYDSRFMWPQTLVSLAPVAVAIVVPWLAFRFAMQQDQRRWAREERARVYIDLLVEASAEKDWLEYQLAYAEHPEDMPRFEDHRMSDLDRRRLGARVLAYGSREVVRRHNIVSREGLWATLSRDDAQRHGARLRRATAFDDLQQQIRRELEAEHGRLSWSRRRKITAPRTLGDSPPWAAHKLPELGDYWRGPDAPESGAKGDQQRTDPSHKLGLLTARQNVP